MMVSRHSMTSLVTVTSTSLSFKPLFLKNRTYLYISACTGNLLALMVGLCFGWSSPYIPQLSDKEFLPSNPLGRIITNEEASWIGSLLPLGAIFGTFIAGATAQKFGRKIAMLFNCAILFTVVYLLLAFAKNVYLFFVVRFFSGLAVSGVYTTVPMYLAEISEDEIRGFICTSIMVFETLGELIVYCMGPYVDIFTMSMVIVAFGSFSAVNIIVFLPESPYYLLSIKKRSKAEKALMKLRSTTEDGVADELAFMQTVVDESEGAQGRIIDLWKTKASRRAEIITMGLTIFQHWSGIVPVLLYSQSIFLETGSHIPSHFCTMAVGAVQFLASFVTPNLVDRLGRKLLLFMSAIGMCVSTCCLGVYFYLKDSGEDLSAVFWLPVACLIFYIISYISGFGPLIWAIMGEIFPNHLKAAAFSVGVFFWWLMGFTVGRVFHPLSTAIGMGGCFFVFGGMCFLATLFISWRVFETKGKNLHEIQMILNS